MDVRVLIDTIVAQTTVLIAQLATSAGVRAPMADVADQVFLGLVAELERQGVSRKVAADMFGLALRSYQQKVQRLSESRTMRGVTLWQAVYKYLQDEEVALRADILMRFRHDNEASVRGVLNDLMESGLVYKTGRGDSTVYRVTTQEDLERAARHGAGVQHALLWVAVYRNSPVAASDLAALLGLSEGAVETDLAVLHRDGRITKLESDDGVLYSSDTCLLPVGDEVGFEAALFDHYQAVVNAICAKIRNGATRALPSDQLGGSTYSFDVWSGHPYEDEVRGLLAEFRGRLGSLWDEVHAHNQACDTRPEHAAKVTVYLGQEVRLDLEEES